MAQPQFVRSAVTPLARWLFTSAEARRLASVRIGLHLILAFRLAATDFDVVASQPKALFDPVSAFHLLSRMPSAELATLVQIVGVVSACLAALGIAPRLSLRAAFVSAIFLGLMLNSTGKIIHTDVFLLLCLLPLQLDPTATAHRWSVTSLRHKPRCNYSPRYGWPIQLAMLIIALGYFFAGLQKLRFSGLAWVTSDNLRWTLDAASSLGHGVAGLGSAIADLGPIVHVGAAMALLLELTFVLCLPFPRLRWLMVPGVCLLHFGILATMGIDYLGQVLTVLVVFINWPHVVRMVGDHRPSSSTDGPTTSLGQSRRATVSTRQTIG